MRKTRLNSPWSRTAILALVASGLSCALYLDWDPAGLPCDEEKRCADTYSCLVNRCVEEGSLPLAATCSQPEQCEGNPDVTCGSAPFTCRTVCTNLFKTTGNCEADEYCRPERSRDFEDQWIGTCFLSECRQADDCDSDRVCVPISGSAGACLVNCTYSYSTGSYTDTCGASLETDPYCQPIGISGQQSLVCLEALRGRQPIGSPCDPVITPCERSAACVEGTCRQYCTTVPTSNCPTNQVCTTFENEGAVALFSACIP